MTIATIETETIGIKTRATHIDTKNIPVKSDKNKDYSSRLESGSVHITQDQILGNKSRNWSTFFLSQSSFNSSISPQAFYIRRKRIIGYIVGFIILDLALLVIFFIN